jgi:hypothetical protein
MMMYAAKSWRTLWNTALVLCATVIYPSCLAETVQVHTFDYVTMAVVKVVKTITRKKAHRITVQCHSHGTATVTTTWKQMAKTMCAHRHLRPAPSSPSLVVCLIRCADTDRCCCGMQLSRCLKLQKFGLTSSIAPDSSGPQ